MSIPRCGLDLLGLLVDRHRLAFHCFLGFQHLLVVLGRLAFLVAHFLQLFLVVRVVLGLRLVLVGRSFLGRFEEFLVCLVGQPVLGFQRVLVDQLVLVVLAGLANLRRRPFLVLQPFRAIPLVQAFLVDQLQPWHILDIRCVVDVGAEDWLLEVHPFRVRRELRHDRVVRLVRVVLFFQQDLYRNHSILLGFQSEKQLRQMVEQRRNLLELSLRSLEEHHIRLDEPYAGERWREPVFW